MPPLSMQTVMLYMRLAKLFLMEDKREIKNLKCERRKNKRVREGMKQKLKPDCSDLLLVFSKYSL